MRQRTLTILSTLFGLMMINAGLNKFFNYMPVPEDMPEIVMQTMGAFLQIGWLFPLIAVVEIVGGALFIWAKTRALGALVILPVMVGIVLFHSFQSPENLAIAIVLFTINIWVIAENKAKYMPMIA